MNNTDTKGIRNGASWRPRLFAAVVVFGTAAGALAQPAVNLTYLEGQNPVAADAVTAHGPNLFGDSVNLFNGALSFQHTDLSLPGNSALPVSIARSYSPGRSESVQGQMGDWDLEVPRIGGTFASTLGWVDKDGGTRRCTNFSIPQAPVYFSGSDFWRGTTLSVPGQGRQEVLRRDLAYTDAPTDGGSYPMVTHGNWQLSCLPTIRNGAGEGFVAVAPDGTRYRFDWLASRLANGVKKSGRETGRVDVWLMATQVTDRFGNWVRYTYDSAQPLLLTRIEASDGRVITLTNAGGRAVSANDGTRTYQYSYDSLGRLTTVLQPDGSRWTFNLGGMTPIEGWEVQGEGANCESPGSFFSDTLTGSITHPSGATGTFATRMRVLHRSNVDRYCKYVPNSTTLTTGAVWSKAVVTQGLETKRISGPGMPAQSWSYAYAGTGGWSSCTTPACQSGIRTVTVTDPAGAQTRHLFGTRWRENEGQLLQVDEGWNGTTALRTTTHRYRLPAGQPYRERFGYSPDVNDINTDWLSTRHRPTDRRQVTQQGVTFTWEVSSFDALVRPVAVTKSSTLGYSRTETSTYSDHRGLWVMGQLAGVTDGNGWAPQTHAYDPGTASLVSRSAFGRVTDRYTWAANGLLQTHRDGAGNTTTFSNFMRGVPQRVDYADGSAKTAVVNNLGLVTSRTNAVGTTTTFTYDVMGRVSSIAHPTEPGLSYHATTQTFEQVNAIEYGIPAGHWRQTVVTGNARTVRYFDAQWRERLKRTYDAANEAGTASVVETRWDHAGRKYFSSYPARSLASVDGVPAGASTAYDPLGRVIAQYQDSELGLLTTRTLYLPGFQKQVINARGHATTFAHQAFDTPAEDAIVNAWAPEGATLTISRDPRGKALAISRSGPWAGGTVSATRSYVYDAHQRLCKTIEPETGATIQAYDAASNIAWRASGLNLPGTASCDDAGVPAGRKISFGYDARNRLVSSLYGDGSSGINRNYTADGLLAQIGSGGAVWNYSYNNRRLMTAEAMVFNGNTYSFGHGVDAYGHVSSLTYPGNATVNYSPDALGRPTHVSGHASGVWYHPNGQIGGYTLANGIAHTATQTLRGKPARWTDSGVIDDTYSYDANANITAITDGQEGGLTSRSMAYDGLDRLTSASGIWGAGNYAYDPLDNLRTTTVGSRSTIASYDASHRLATLAVNGAIQTYGYDANGNLTLRGTQGFTFDIGNRLQAATAKATYAYDGHGRRHWVAYQDGSTKLQVYGTSGKLLYSQHSAQGATRHIYLGSRLIAEVNATGVATYTHTDMLGSPVARTSATGQLLSRTRYEPYGATAAGTNPTGIGFTGHVNDADTGLVYMQQRYYEPVAGRFLSVDPVVTDAKAGGHFNRYNYAESSPYKFVDPDGRAPDNALGEVVGGGAGGAGLRTVRIATGSTGASLNPGKPSATAGERVQANRAMGEAFQNKVGTDLKSTRTDVVKEVTIKTPSGTSTRMDLLSRDPIRGIVCTECKASATAPLTTNQKIAHPEIAKKGGVVVGAGKPGYPPGTVIPPQIVEVVRPK